MGLRTAQVNRLMEAHEFYAGPASPAVATVLSQAACTDPASAETLLLAAQRAAPDALPVYFALYKFYFYRGRLAEAERYTRSGLATAARLASFTDDWHALTPSTTDWLCVNSPQHFYLFSLKALAFIRLRQGDTIICRLLLDTLAALDPQDTVGASVIRALLEEIRNDNAS